MIHYQDRTFCVHPDCACAPVRRLTPEIEEAARRAGMDLSVAYLCDGKESAHARLAATKPPDCIMTKDQPTHWLGGEAGR